MLAVITKTRVRNHWKLTPVLTTVIQFFFAKGNAHFWPNLSVSIRGLTNGWTDGWESVRIDR